MGLDAAGYHQVEVICADGAGGHPGGAPYDRIIATAGAWDIAPAWWQQLVAGGRLVVPLCLHASGLTRSVAFDLRGPDRMVSRSARVCGFVPLRGTAAAHAGRSVQLTDDVVLYLDASDPADEAGLGQALTYPAYERWTGVAVGDDEPAGHLDLWLATVTGRFARLAVGPGAREARWPARGERSKTLPSTCGNSRHGHPSSAHPASARWRWEDQQKTLTTFL